MVSLLRGAQKFSFFLVLGFFFEKTVEMHGCQHGKMTAFNEIRQGLPRLSLNLSVFEIGSLIDKDLFPLVRLLFPTHFQNQFSYLHSKNSFNNY